MKPLLILDLDETLIYSTPKYSYKEQIYDFLIEEHYYVKKRPYVDTFLKNMSEHFELGVWTASTRDYATEIVNQLFIKNNLQLVLFHSREKCTKQEYSRSLYDSFPQNYYIKDLKKIKKQFNLDKVLIVDDLPIGLQRNYGNLIKIEAYKGDEFDAELEHLEDYLLSIKDLDNLRAIEKRNWCQNMIKEQIKSKKFKF